MRPRLTLVALLLLDVALFEGIVWLRDAVRISSEIELPLVAEFAFMIGGALALTLTPALAWLLLDRNDSASPSSIPMARIVR
jgi:hypothetical protein